MATETVPTDPLKDPKDDGGPRPVRATTVVVSVLVRATDGGGVTTNETNAIRLMLERQAVAATNNRKPNSSYSLEAK